VKFSFYDHEKKLWMLVLVVLVDCLRHLEEILCYGGSRKYKDENAHVQDGRVAFEHA
jgi:hypothetical protein